MNTDPPVFFTTYQSMEKAFGPFSLLASLWAARKRIKSTVSTIEQIRKLQENQSRTPEEDAQLKDLIDTEAMNRAIQSMMETRTRRGPRRGAVNQEEPEPVSEQAPQQVQQEPSADPTLPPPPEWMQTPIRRGAPLDAVRNLGQSDIKDSSQFSPVENQSSDTTDATNPFNPLIAYVQSMFTKPVTREGAVGNTLAAGAATENMDMGQFVPPEIRQVQSAVSAGRQIARTDSSTFQPHQQQVFLLDGLKEDGGRLGNLGVTPDGKIVMIVPGNGSINRASVHGVQNVQDAQSWDWSQERWQSNPETRGSPIFYADPLGHMWNLRESPFLYGMLRSKVNAERHATPSEPPSVSEVVLQSLAPFGGSLQSALGLPRSETSGILGHIGKYNTQGLPGIDLLEIGKVPERLIDPRTGLLKFAPTANLSSTLLEINNPDSNQGWTAEDVLPFHLGDSEINHKFSQLRNGAEAAVGQQFLDSIDQSKSRDGITLNVETTNMLDQVLEDWDSFHESALSDYVDSSPLSIIDRIGLDRDWNHSRLLAQSGQRLPELDSERIASLARKTSIGGRPSVTGGHILTPMASSFDQNVQNQKTAFGMISAEQKAAAASAQTFLNTLKNMNTQVVSARESYVVQYLMDKHPELSAQQAKQIITQPFSSEKFFLSGPDNFDIYNGLDRHIQAMKNAGHLPETFSSEKLANTIREAASSWADSTDREKVFDKIENRLETLGRGRDSKGFLKPTTLHPPGASKEEKLSVNQPNMPLYKEKEMSEPMELSLTDVFYGKRLRKSPDFASAEITPSKKPSSSPSKAIVAAKAKNEAITDQLKRRIGALAAGGKPLADQLFPLSPEQQQMASDASAHRAKVAALNNRFAQQIEPDTSPEIQKNYDSYLENVEKLEQQHYGEIANALLAGEDITKLQATHQEQIEALKKLHGFGQGSMEQGTALGPKSMAFPFQLKYVRKLPARPEHMF